MDKIFALSKLKAFAHKKSHVTYDIKFVVHGVENITEKGENAGYHDFLPSL